MTAARVTEPPFSLKGCRCQVPASPSRRWVREGVGNAEVVADRRCHCRKTTLQRMRGGPIADRLGRATVIVPGLLSAALSMLLLSVASSQALFLTAALLSGAGFGLLQPGMQSLVVDRVPPRERAAGLATLQQAWDVGGSGGAFALGPVGSALGVANTFGIVGVGAIVGAVGFLMGNAKSSAKLPDDQQTFAASSSGDN